MNKIFTYETLGELPERSFTELKTMLLSDYVTSRIMAATQIGLIMEENYEKCSELLLDELSSELHFREVNFGVKSSWIIAAVLAENLKEVDYAKLNALFANWSIEDKAEIMKWLEEYPEHRLVLEFGRYNS